MALINLVYRDQPFPGRTSPQRAFLLRWPNTIAGRGRLSARRSPVHLNEPTCHEFADNTFQVGGIAKLCASGPVTNGQKQIENCGRHLEHPCVLRTRHHHDGKWCIALTRATSRRGGCEDRLNVIGAAKEHDAGPLADAARGNAPCSVYDLPSILHRDANLGQSQLACGDLVQIGRLRWFSLLARAKKAAELTGILNYADMLRRAGNCEFVQDHGPVFRHKFERPRKNRENFADALLVREARFQVELIEIDAVQRRVQRRIVLLAKNGGAARKIFQQPGLSIK